MTDIDPAAAMAAHSQHRWGCADQYQFGSEHCEPYRLAEALVTARTERDAALTALSAALSALADERDRTARVERLCDGWYDRAIHVSAELSVRHALVCGTD